MDEREQLEDEPNQHDFVCTFEGCGKTFSSLAILCTHEAVCSKAGATPRVTCEICGSRTYACSLKKHMILHRPPEHQCPVCRKMFHFRYNLLTHLKVHANELDPLGEGSYEGTQFLLDMVAAPPKIPKTKLESENFPCKVCPAVFKTSKSLRYHLNVHEGLTPYTCRNEGCSEAFSNHQERYYHERACRGESTKKTCSECGLEFNLKSFARHMRKAHQVVPRVPKSASKGKLYPCGHCSAVLKSEKTLMCHVNQHKGIRPYQCRNEGCRESFSWDSDRRNHEKRCRETASNCPVCGLELANGSVRQDHMAAFHKDDKVLAEMLKLEPTDGTRSDPNELPDGRLKCPECGKIFAKRDCFEYHMNMHRGVRPFDCVQCGRGFFSKQAHAYHEKKCLAGLKLRKARILKPSKAPEPVVVSVETNVEVLKDMKESPRPTKRKRSKPKAVPMQCELCNMVLRSERMYEYHMAVHNGAGFYRCKHNGCEETFQTVRERQLHDAERHGGEMPPEAKPKERKTFMCEVCSAVCLNRKSFRNHMNAHSGIKKLVCRNEGCEVTFYSHSARIAHEEPCRGEVSTCPVCGIKLKTKNILRIHMRRQHPDQLPPSKAKVRGTSTEKKTFSCSICSRVYRSSKSLDDHMNDHTGAKPFQCRNEGCTERFARRVVRSYHEEGCRGLVAPCPFCDAVLKNSTTLKNHVASYHATEKESFDKGIFTYQHQLRKQSELEKSADQEDCVEEGEDSEEMIETLDETQIDIKRETDDDMQIEWLEDIIEEDDLDSVLLEVKDEVVEESELGDEDGLDNDNEEVISKADDFCELENPGGIQVELDAVEVKSEVDTENETDPLTHVEGELLIEPLNELKAKSAHATIGSKPFKCRNDNGCQRSFGNHQSRTHHEPRCRGESFHCPRQGCSYGPTSNLKMQQHLRRAHGKEEESTAGSEDLSASQKFKCDECPSTFSNSKSLKYHMNRHKGETPYPCQKPGCGKSFASPAERRLHSCDGVATPLSCSLCSIEFRNQRIQWYHMRTKHGNRASKDQRHVCEVCGASFAMAKSLRYHRYKHDGTQPFECRKEGCGKRFRNTDLRSYHEMGCGGVSVECLICHIQLVNRRILERHIKKVHENPRPMEPESFMCEICSKVFRRRCDFSTHMKLHEEKEGREPVDKLEADSADTIDAGDGWVKCGECSKYLRKSNYRYHLNSHRGVRPYACSKCQQGFFSKQAHWSHEKKCLAGKKMRKSPRVYIPLVNMEPKEPTVHQCSVCSQIFPNRYTLYHHKQRHLGEYPLRCSEGCTTTFSRVGLQRKHMRECHGIGAKPVPKMEKTLKCDYCPEMFGFKASLVRHMKLHNDPTRAQCTNEGCNKTFASEKMLAKHLATCGFSLSMFGEQ